MSYLVEMSQPDMWREYAQSPAHLSGTSPHFGNWHIRVDAHGAIVVTLEDKTIRFSPEAFFEIIFNKRYEELRKSKS